MKMHHLHDRVNKEIYLRAAKWLAWGLIACLIIAAAFLYGASWYYSHKMEKFKNSVEVTESKAYQSAIDQVISQAEKKISESKSEHERWLALKDLAFFEVDKGKLDEAQAYANELLALAQKYKNDPFYGNALHIGHISLGRIALKRNNISEATKQMLEAGRTPGSPELRDFGPNMLLAQELFQKGQKDAVLEYIGLCGKFWKSDKIKFWQDTIKQNGIPDFDSNLFRV